MTATESVLVYECISGGGFAGGSGGSGAPRALPDAALLTQGTTMRNALVADLLAQGQVSVSCATAWYAPLPPALAGARALTPDPRDGAVRFLGNRSPEYDRVWVIAPESDGLLATLAETVGAPRWVGCSAAAIRLASSKSATRSWLAAHHIAVPASWLPGQPEPGPDGHWVVKPDDGAGCTATLLHGDFAQARADLLGRLDRGHSATLERWIDGVPLSLSLLCTAGGAELLSINLQHIIARVGDPLAYKGVEIAAIEVDGAEGRQLEPLARQIATALPGLAGYVGVDLVWRPAGPDRPGTAVVVEINPRLTCAYKGLSAALGRNLADEILNTGHLEAAAHAMH